MADVARFPQVTSPQREMLKKCQEDGTAELQPKDVTVAQGLVLQGLGEIWEREDGSKAFCVNERGDHVAGQPLHPR